MLIEQFDATGDSQRLRACFDMTLAGWPVDHAGQAPWAFDSFAGKWGPGFAAAPQQTWLATDGTGEPVGAYLLRLPEKENATMAFCTMVVAPPARRSGVGSALLRHCAEQASKAGRVRLAGDGPRRLARCRVRGSRRRPRPASRRSTGCWPSTRRCRPG